MPRPFPALLLLAALPAFAAEAPRGGPMHGGPVIDLHLHAFAMDDELAGRDRRGDRVDRDRAVPQRRTAAGTLYNNAARFLRLS